MASYANDFLELWFTGTLSRDNTGSNPAKQSKKEVTKIVG